MKHSGQHWQAGTEQHDAPSLACLRKFPVGSLARREFTLAEFIGIPQFAGVLHV